MSKHLTPELKSQLLQLCSIKSIHEDQIAFSADGTTAYIGDPSFDKFAGRVIVCTKKAGACSWVMMNAIMSTASIRNTWFGACLALSPDGSFLMVGAPHHDAKKGGVHLFTICKTGELSEKPFLQPQTSECGDGFGSSIVFMNNGDVAVIAAPGISGNIQRYGVMYTYVHRVGGWELQSSYAPPDCRGGDRFSETLSSSTEGRLLVTTKSQRYTLTPTSNFMHWKVVEKEDLKRAELKEEKPKLSIDMVDEEIDCMQILTEEDLLKAAIKKLKKRLKQIIQPT